MKAVIAGGGIGGLTAALCLHHFGWDVTVVEQTPVLEEIGAGLQLSPNAMKVLVALGLSDAIVDVGFCPRDIEMRMGKSGNNVFRIPLSDHAVAKWGAAYVHIHRADLMTVLADAVAKRIPGALRLGHTVRSYDQDAECASLLLSNGDRLTGDVIVGADGIHSIIRQQMIGSDTPIFTGNVAWRAVVPVEKLGRHVPPPSACAWVGPGRHAVTYLLRGGTLANVVAVVERDDWQGESWSERGNREEALTDFARWHPIIRKMLSVADEHYRWALFEREPLKQWTNGRAVLLGDACHAMLPFMAQGAAMAIEDGWVLAQSLSQCADSGKDGKIEVEKALLAYQNKRLARTSRVQKASRANMKRFHISSKREQLAAFGPMWAAARLKPELFHSQQDWLYGHDVTR